MSKKTITVRQSMAPDVTFQVNFGLNPSKEREVRVAVQQWESVTGLAFTRMPHVDLSGDVCPINRGQVVVRVKHPVANCMPVTFYWER